MDRYAEVKSEIAEIEGAMSVLQKRIDAYSWDHRDFRVEEIQLNRVELDELRTRLDPLLEEERVLADAETPIFDGRDDLGPDADDNWVVVVEDD